MAKIKSPLLMADGARVRTMEELREHFDIASVLAYYDSGKLQEWLENYYYDKEANEISALDLSSSDIKEKICSILGVSSLGEDVRNISLADISDKNKRLEKLKKYTSEDELLKAVDYVAFTQDELQGLLDRGTKKIYLCQEQGKFEIPNTEGVTYIGVNHPSVSVPEWFGEKGIVLKNVDIGIEEMLLSAEKCSSDQDYGGAVKLWSIAAAFGNAEAQRELGRCYCVGNGVAQDYVEAYKWYRKAAEQGHVGAQNCLGACYSNGEGVEQDDEEAYKWYRKAAEQGDAHAQYNIGVCYDCGAGVTQDYGEAIRWYRKAAEQGDAYAQNSLGVCYHHGEGIAQDYEEAIKWYRKAAEQGNECAQNNLGNCYYYGEGVAEDNVQAYKWYRKAAEQGHAGAQRMVGECYYYGYGVPENYGEACKWYGKAAERGNAVAQRMVGECYENGQGVTQDEDEACKWYKKAAEQGDVTAQRKVGEYYLKMGMLEDNFYIKESYKWLKKAAEQGDAEAQFELGGYHMISMMTMLGEAIGEDDYETEKINGEVEEAYKWYRKAAEQGYTEAQYTIGTFYENGTCVEQDYGKALEWYGKAMEQGNESAYDAWDNLTNKMMEDYLNG
ncbi:MAG: hypothetical protein K2O32_08505 [Acetatifactor sp.]|nr:hypothetical protein [Acetatifactor sp.]